MGKIAVTLSDACAERERRGAEPALRASVLAENADWYAEDVLCTYRPSDASFEERHDRYRVAVVGAGTFHCRGAAGRELLTPGSLLLGNASDSFECSHEHGTGDRCLAFGYTPELFERLAFDAGVRGRARFKRLRVPPIDATAALVAEICAVWLQPPSLAAWDELGLKLAAAAVRAAAHLSRVPRSPPNAERGVARAVRLIERDVGAPLDLSLLAREATLSRFHFVRTFARVTGLTPHRYLKRARLRRAAGRLASSDERIIEVALECGFRDVSNFNHAFRTEFGTTPREQRRRWRAG